METGEKVLETSWYGDEQVFGTADATRAEDAVLKDGREVLE